MWQKRFRNGPFCPPVIPAQAGIQDFVMHPAREAPDGRQCDKFRKYVAVGEPDMSLLVKPTSLIVEGLRFVMQAQEP
ncbi:MAG TPA: hypothetical protein VGX03_06100 [Candidatus Binatia bacterium]|nr:hypothetical protein [Candidatus Binatia bacterium]